MAIALLYHSSRSISLSINPSSKLLSVAEDGNLNVYDAKKGQKVDQFEFQNELYAITTNSMNKIAIGGEENKVDVYSIGSSLSSDDFAEPQLAMKFNSKIQRIQWAGAKFILAFSEDSEAQMYNEENEHVLYFKYSISIIRVLI